MARYVCYKSKHIIASLLIISCYIHWWNSLWESVTTRANIRYVGVTNDTIQRYDLRIIVIVYNRAQSLLRLLNSLNEAEYGSDSIKLEVWIDRSEEGNIDASTLNTAKTFTFKYGEYEVIPHSRQVGIFGQWLTTWIPDSNSSEIAVILEDDLTVSKYFWRYLQLVHRKYDKKPDINGYSLQGYSITLSKQNPHAVISGPNDSFVFRFPSVGTLGFSPSTKNWMQFLEWFENLDKDTKPYVPGNIATIWFRDLSRQGKGNTIVVDVAHLLCMEK